MDKAQEIANIGLFLAQRGWSPATSSNYSAKLSADEIAITRSGIDKYNINASDILVADMNGVVVKPLGQKASAETLIHTTIYKQRPDAGAVLHTHSVLGTRLSLKFQSQNEILISGYELLKGLAGNNTHEMTEVVPILDNDQDMVRFSIEADQLLQSQSQIHGFLIAGHGLYTWGKDLAEARRHIETYEFLFQCLEKELRGI